MPLTLNQLTSQFPESELVCLQTVTLPGKSLADGLQRLAQAAVDSVRNGARLYSINTSAFEQENVGWTRSLSWR